MATTLLAVGTTAANSAEFTLNAGVTDRIFLVDAQGASVPFRSDATVQIKGQNNEFFDVAWLSFWQPSAHLQGPGTFRVKRPAGAEVGVDRDSGADALATVMSLDPTAGLLLGGAAPNEQQRAAVRAGVGAMAQSAAVFGHRVVPFGDSITIAGDTQTGPWFTRSDSYADSLCSLSGGRLHLVYNAGKGGDTSSNLLARFDSDVAPHNPNVVTILIGTNDFTVSTLDSTYRSNIRALAQKCYEIGATPIFFTTTPVNSMGAEERKRVSRNSVWMKRWANQNSIVVVDAFAAVVDPATSGDWNASFVNVDGIHPNAAGAQAIGLAGWSVLDSKWPSITTRAVCNLDPMNLVTNGLFLSGTTLATGFTQTWGVDTGTAGFSLVADATIPGGKVQRQTHTATTGHLTQSQTISTGWAAGDTLSIDCDVNLALAGAEARISVTFGGTVSISGYIMKRTLQGRSKFFMEFTIPAGATSMAVALASGYAAGSMTGTCDYGALTIRNLSNPSGSFFNDGGSIVTP